MKVAHVTPSYHPARTYGGPPESAYQLSRHLGAGGCDVRVLTTDADAGGRLDVDTTRELDLEHHRVRYGRHVIGQLAPSVLARLPELVAWSDVVHLNAIYDFTTLPTLAACAALGRPVVWSLRGALSRWAGSRRVIAKHAFEAACFRLAPRRLVLHATSADEAEQAAARARGARIVVIPNGVELPATIPERRDDGTLKLLALGRIDPIKGIDRLLDALALARLERPWTLEVAGAGDAAYAERLRAQSERLGLAARVRFLGALAGGDKERAFARADLLVAPSHRENFGLAIAEALARGVPVIAGRGTPWRGLEEHGCGLWRDNEAAALAEAIEECAARPLGEMGRRGRAWMERDFTWASVAERMRAVYEELIA